MEYFLTSFFVSLFLFFKDDFYGLHRQEVLAKYAPRLKIGTIENETPKIAIPKPGDLSKVPYAEPSYWMGFKSPYFK